MGGAGTPYPRRDPGTVKRRNDHLVCTARGSNEMVAAIVASTDLLDRCVALAVGDGVDDDILDHDAARDRALRYPRAIVADSDKIKASFYRRQAVNEISGDRIFRECCGNC
jgi:hypothetical protein